MNLLLINISLYLRNLRATYDYQIIYYRDQFLSLHLLFCCVFSEIFDSLSFGFLVIYVFLENTILELVRNEYLPLISCFTPSLNAFHLDNVQSASNLVLGTYSYLVESFCNSLNILPQKLITFVKIFFLLMLLVPCRIVFLWFIFL